MLSLENYNNFMPVESLVWPLADRRYLIGSSSCLREYQYTRYSVLHKIFPGFLGQWRSLTLPALGLGYPATLSLVGNAASLSLSRNDEIACNPSRMSERLRNEPELANINLTILCSTSIQNVSVVTARVRYSPSTARC